MRNRPPPAETKTNEAEASRDPDHAPGEDPVWVLLPPGQVPQRWRGRAVSLLMVPLVPREAADLLAGSPVGSVLEPMDERVAHLAASGVRAPAIADELGISARNVYRRLARLRRALGVSGAASLAGELSRRGFGGR